ncbi:UNKNOWN [Stylonychia lemnae]|uniref:MARVEL domain-containing protein n=1 Tax=Stylonychia lemnae TaxID=5949 RepID=A0A078AZ96_STYLE|nr:UNKNOWN [Stylonychia lemnae]|eukprot:CDW87469.1 UNKNOWN [Stylonychia lemnae]
MQSDSFVILMQPNGALNQQSQLIEEPKVQQEKKKTVEIGVAHVALVGIIIYQASVLGPLVLNSLTTIIASAVASVLTIIGWILYVVFVNKMGNSFILKFGIPVLLAVLTVFDTLYLFSYVLDWFCPDTDPDGCTEEANVILIVFIVFFSIAVNLLWCCYRVIDRIDG